MGHDTSADLTVPAPSRTRGTARTRRTRVAPCPGGVHAGPVLWRTPARHEGTDGYRVATPLDGTCIGMHAPHTTEEQP